MGFNTIFYVRNDNLEYIKRNPTGFVNYVVDTASSGRLVDPNDRAALGSAVSSFGARHNDEARVILVHHGYPQELDTNPVPPNAELAKKRLLILKQAVAEYENRLKKVYPKEFEKRSKRG